jgi:antitoxin HicB
MIPQTIGDYLTLPYTIEIIRDESDNYSGWFARVIELPGCMTEADTLEGLEEMIQDAMRAWIETALEDGQLIPEPYPANSLGD